MPRTPNDPAVAVIEYFKKANVDAAAATLAIAKATLAGRRERSAVMAEVYAKKQKATAKGKLTKPPKNEAKPLAEPVGV